MPQLKEIAQQSQKKKFVKKSYRPWDLGGNEENIRQNADEYNNNINKEQTENQLVTIDKQKENKQTTDREQLDNKKISIKEQIDNKKTTNKQQINNKLCDKKIKEAIRKLTGQQEKLFYFIIDILNVRNELESGPISTLTLSRVVSCSCGCIKTSLARLVEKNLLYRLPGKKAKGGFVRIMVNEAVKTLASEVKCEKTVANIMGSNQSTQKGEQIDNNNFVYNNSNSIKNTTTITLPEEWLEIDYTPLKKIGFSETQLIQIYKTGKNSPDVVQDSINKLAFGLENTEKTKSYENPLNTFMGVLRKGGSWVEDKYRSPQELALQEIVQRKKEEKERITALTKELFEQSFDEWFSEISDSEAEKIFLDMDRAGFHQKYDRKSRGVIGFLMKYFREVFWLEKAKEYGIKDADLINGN